MNLKNKTEEEIRGIFKPGKAFYYLCRRYRVVEYVNDGKNLLIVVKTKIKPKKTWVYDVWDWNTFYPVNVRFGFVTLTERKENVIY